MTESTLVDATHWIEDGGKDPGWGVTADGYRVFFRVMKMF